MQKNVLLVDNDAEYIEANKKAFEDDGFHVTTASTSLDALDKLNEYTPDIIVTEIMLENKDSGFTFCYHSKKKHPEVPVIILSEVVRKTGITFNLSTREDKDWIKADEFINKPISPVSLVCRAKRLLG